MSKTIETSRRSFLATGLKSGALVAAPVAGIAVPAAAFAEDGSKAALTLIQDERAIEALNRDFLRSFNQGGAMATQGLFANRAAPDFAKGVSRLSLDAAEAPKSFAIADDGTSATAQYACTVETAEELEGEETLVQMARLQGNGSAAHSARKTLSAQYSKRQHGWVISSLELA